MELQVLEATVERFEEGTYQQCSEERGYCGGQVVLVNHIKCFMSTLMSLVKVGGVVR